MASVRDTPETSEDRAVIGWLVPADERERLLERFRPRHERTIADHVTLRAGVTQEAPPPQATTGAIVGVAEDEGVQALVVEIDGETARPGGGTYHITWSLGPMRKARESNDVIAAHGWRKLDEPVPVRLEPARFLG